MKNVKMLIELNSTFRCNLDCKMCSIPDYVKEAPLKDFITFFKKNKKLINFLIFTGGEITLRPDYINFIIKLHSIIKPKNTTICSNLTLTKKALEMAKQIKNKNILIATSIDGDKKTHNKIRRNSNAYQNTINTIKQIKKRYPKIPINITMTLLYENKDKILEVYYLARQLDTQFMINLVYPLNLLSYTKEDKTKLIKDLKIIFNEEMKRYKSLFCSYRIYLKLYFKKIFEIINLGYDKDKCLAGDGYISIGPDGKIYPCSRLLRQKNEIGDIYTISSINKLKKFDCNIHKNCFEICKFNSGLTKSKFFLAMFMDL